MRKFLERLSLFEGRVIGSGFTSLAEDDLPRVPVGVAGGYSSANVIIDQYGRVVAAANGAGSGGTVTSVSVVTANGVSGSVADPTTTPAITITLGDITPSKVNGQTITSGSGTLTLSTFTLTVAGTASITGTNTGDQTITLTGAVTGSGTGTFATTLADDIVTTAKILAANVTYAKIQDVSAASKLLGRGSAGGSGDVEEITLGANLTMSGTTLTVSVTGGSDPRSAIYPPFTVGTDDDEFDDANFTGWTLVNDGTHLATNTETNDVLSISLPGTDTAAHLQAYMKTPGGGIATGDIIEVCVRGMGVSQNFNVFGLIFADGTTYGAGAQVTCSYSPTEAQFRRAAFTNYNTQGANAGVSVNGREAFGDLFLRLKYVSANTWSAYTSPDGVSWLAYSASFAVTLTPTSVGFFCTTWGGTNPFIWSVRYFKKTT